MSEPSASGELQIRDTDAVVLLQWALPRLGMRWAGFRKVRRQVIRRVRRRISELELPNLQAYRERLEHDPQEWSVLDSFCRISISRFYRDRDVFDCLRKRILPELARAATARGATSIRCWSAGCASGEEPYTLMMMWRFELQPSFPHLDFRVTATDVDQHLLARAREARYEKTSLSDLPADWSSRAFVEDEGQMQLKPDYCGGIEWIEQDIRHAAPAGPFDLVLCRHLAFTYFDGSAQRQVLDRIAGCLLAAGFLVVAKKESLPGDLVRPVNARLGIFQLTGPCDPTLSPDA